MASRTARQRISPASAESSTSPGLGSTPNSRRITASFSSRNLAHANSTVPPGPSSRPAPPALANSVHRPIRFEAAIEIPGEYRKLTTTWPKLQVQALRRRRRWNQGCARPPATPEELLARVQIHAAGSNTRRRSPASARKSAAFLETVRTP